MIKSKEKMIQCHFPGCEKMIKSYFYFCFDHKSEPYKSVCNIHGSQIYVDGFCPVCSELKISKYTIKKSKSNYYLDGKLIDISSKEWSWFKDYFPIFANHSRTKANQRIKRIGKQTGVYGIFYKKSKRCLYIGQSTNIIRRSKQHKEKIMAAKKDKSRFRIGKTVPVGYYYMAKAGIANLEFKCVFEFPKSYLKTLTRDQVFIALTICEQWGFDTFHPKTNSIAARPTDYKTLEKMGRARKEKED